MQIILIAIFGLVGIFARYGTDTWIARHGGLAHWGTFAINLAGSFVVTLIYVLGVERHLISTELRVALLVGLMGGFTTFSSYALQSALLIESGNRLAPILYMALSPICGIALAVAGLHVFRVI